MLHQDYYLNLKLQFLYFIGQGRMYKTQPVSAGGFLLAGHSPTQMGRGVHGSPSKVLSQRVSLQVSYLTSGQYTTAGAAVHFFQVAEKGNSAKKQKRLIVLVDKATFSADLETAMNRCVLISNINEIWVNREHIRPLLGPMTVFDTFIQDLSIVDFIRVIPCTFHPSDPANLVCMYELEEGQLISRKANCRPAALMKDEGIFTKSEHDDGQNSQLEIKRLQDMLQRQTLELFDARTQIEQLRHSLSLAETRSAYAYGVMETHGGNAFYLKLSVMLCCWVGLGCVLHSSFWASSL
eukprot:TRINITY_DN4575_c0_g1_i3.p1 TRINITY_DN4575_c0_g1~~TRINITY_DN4575_c0_g1_i3.p1  ORF type:complete len:294 (+),score=33.57 TRINITY_DN4575_c0_g1_i3:278-1159(+)